MQQEEKQLLLKDLCARLLYGVKCDRYGNSYKLVDIDIKRELVYLLRDGQYVPYSILNGDVIKPYLRPMSSMTKEERKEYDNAVQEDIRQIEYVSKVHEGLKNKVSMYRSVDYLNAHHFDYRGLIEKGLALEAPEGMYDMTIEELNEMLKEELPKELLTEEQFEEVSTMDWLHAVKYIQSTTNIGLKMSKCYYDMYVTKNRQQ